MAHHREFFYAEDDVEQQGNSNGSATYHAALYIDDFNMTDGVANTTNDYFHFSNAQIGKVDNGIAIPSWYFGGPYGVHNEAEKPGVTGDYFNFPFCTTSENLGGDPADYQTEWIITGYGQS